LNRDGFAAREAGVSDFNGVGEDQRFAGGEVVEGFAIGIKVPRQRIADFCGIQDRGCIELEHLQQAGVIRCRWITAIGRATDHQAVGGGDDIGAVDIRNR